MARSLIPWMFLTLLVQNCGAVSVITKPKDSFDGPILDVENADLYNYQNHSCRRTCKDNEAPRECHYTFNIETYYVMSKACYDCPFNMTDCFRPHCITADGVQRSVVVVNRQLPGPSIEVCQGDRIIVNANNLMESDMSTLHWHGQHLHKDPYMDGTPFISQCPILAGHTFLYNFTAETPGTHFWHSHVGFQRGDGLMGAMIVRKAPKNDLLKKFYDFDEHSLIISDWDHETGLDKFLAHYHGTGDNKPPNLLVNGKGRFWDLSATSDDDRQESATMPIETITVKQKKRYRLRLINAEFLNCPIEFSIDNHTMYVVSSDGRDLEPVQAYSLITYAGERFDVIVQMDQQVDNYWMRFRGLLDCGEKFKKAHQVAILRYEGAPEEEPTAAVAYEYPTDIVPPMQVNALNVGTEEDKIKSIPKLDALDPNSEANTRPVDHQFYISYDFYGTDNPKFHRENLYGFKQVKQKVFTPQLNHISMQKPSFALMSQRQLIDDRDFCNSSTVKDCENRFCSCLHVLQVKLNSVVELVLVDEGVPYDANHPFHLHGHDFRVVAMERLASNVTVEKVKQLDRQGRIRRKLDRAPIKDTVTVPDGGYTVIRFFADNPGYWLFHCHIEFHSEIGMALIFKVGQHEDFRPVPKDFPVCGVPTPTETTDLKPTRNSSQDISSNDVNEIQEKVKNSIAKWLPYFLNELNTIEASKRVGSSATINFLSNAAATVLYLTIAVQFRLFFIGHTNVISL